ncbi:MAG: winged helix-turn-helix domain-containing protein [Eubacteriales bacterium]
MLVVSATKILLKFPPKEGREHMRILLAVAEKSLATMMKDILIQGKYFVDTVNDGESALDYARSGIYDGLVCYDSLPFIEITKMLQDEGYTLPILLLSSTSTKNTAGFLMEKNFEKEKFLTSVSKLVPLLGTKEEISFGDLVLGLGILSCGERCLSLTAREFELARLLMTNELLPKESIFLKIWGFDSEAESNVVEAYVSLLRRKMKQLESKVSLQVVRRKGYFLSDENI